MCPEEYKVNTRLVRTRQGWASTVSIPARSRSETVEAPSDTAAGYMSDGLGHVRLMTIAETTQ